MSDTFRVELDTKQLEQFIALAPGKALTAARGIIRDLTLVGIRELKKECPVDTGRMRSSITSEVAPDELSSHSGPTVNYADCVVKGTRPHRIYAKAGGVLRFPPFGAHGGASRATFVFGGKSKNVPWLFARYVNHPGTKPNDFPGRAAENVRDQAPDIIARRLERAMREAAAK